MKQAYLTIDDAPSADFMTKVRYLERHRIPVLFFCIGRLIEARHQDVVEAIRAGFTIGNHSYSHSHFSDLSLAQASDEILKTDKLIDDLYREAGVKQGGKYFRFPYFDRGGHSSGAEYEAHRDRPTEQRNGLSMKTRRDDIQKLLAHLHYQQPDFQGINDKYFAHHDLFSDLDVRCTYDQAEYFLGNPHAPWGLSEEDALLARIDENAPFEGRSLPVLDTRDVILVHDHEKTTDLFFKILDKYRERGISFLAAW